MSPSELSPGDDMGPPSELSSGDDIGNGEGGEWGEDELLPSAMLIYDHVSGHLKSYLNFQNLNFDLKVRVYEVLWHSLLSLE